MQVGELYDPWGAFRGALIPRGVAGMKNITPNAKLIFGTLCFHSHDGQAWPSREQLAEECGISLRAVGTGITELLKAGLIVPDGRCQRRVIYAFAWHPALDGSVRNLPVSSGASVQNLLGSERGSVQNLPATPQTESAESADMPSLGAEDAKCAESAHDSVQNLPTISGKICPIRGDTYSTLHDPLPEAFLSPPPGTSVGGIESPAGGGDRKSPTAPEGKGRASPFDTNLFEELRELIPSGFDDHRLNDWLARVGKVEVKAAIDLLQSAILNRSIRPEANRMNWLESTIERRRKEGRNNASRADAEADINFGR